MIWLVFAACTHQKPVDDTVDPIVWVRSRAGTPIQAHDVDWEFQDVLASVGGAEKPDRSDTSGLTGTLTVPEGCIQVWTVSGGQEAVAVQPSFAGDPPERVAATEAAILGLLEGAEVTLACTEPTPCDDPPCPPTTTDRPIWAVNVRRGEDGWKLRAWRDF